MYNNPNTNYCRSNEYSDTLSKEQRTSARRLMVEQLAELLRHSPRESLYWMETKVDLMELVHDAFMTDMVTDDRGRPMSFMDIVKRACAVLHTPVPYNPYCTVYRARERKGVRQNSFFSRYCWMLYKSKIGNPLSRMVEKKAIEK